MSETAGTQPPGSQISLFEHALQLHLLAPDEPLPRDGAPYPDDALHRGRPRPEPEDRHTVGKDAALVLDAHFARTSALPGELVGAFNDVYAPIYPNARIAAAAERAERRRVHETGRWLVRYGTDRDSVTVGLALVAAVGTVEDVRLIQTIGLLSNQFGPLAAHALERLPGSTDALLWLADRVAGWGRVSVVEALCRLDDPVAQPWLLRRACDGGFLNAYFVGKIAQVTRLHEVVTGAEVDDEIVDHTGRLLLVMTFSQGMGVTLSGYPHAEAVLAAHLRHLEQLGPSATRYCTAAWLANSLGEHGDAGSIGPVQRWQPYRDNYLALLARDDWCEVARDALAAKDPGIARLVGTPSGRRLPAFANRPNE
ncbi:hypothetical protein [Yinghuangia seranimata]|uniref:hypothetical protein n=1 Tax=Yinghuangia seranimata TaxID=408067 RepID=UPI00248BF08A|nr:hypothetical protein [Yinghuangia seranimata]MDI2128650.1 hypothetical protein [Yinghuangia seranimata]